MKTSNMKNKAFSTLFVIGSAAAAIMSVNVIASAQTPAGASVEMSRDADNRVRENGPELPREWRWERKARNFNDMFRQK